MNYNRASMKQEVRLAMKNTKPRPIWVALLFTVIVSAGASLIQLVLSGLMGANALAAGLAGLSDSFVAGGDPEQMLEKLVELLLVNGDLISSVVSGGILASILSFLWTSLMNTGFVGYSLDMVRGKQPGVGRIFSAFPKFGKVILSRILVAVFSFLWGLLLALGVVIGAVIVVLLGEVSPAIAAVLLVLLYVGVVAFALWIYLRYALVDCLVMDHGISGLEALTVSKQLMKGNKWRLFVLQLSFIGWYLLYFVVVLVCAGVIALGAYFLSAGSTEGVILGVLLMMIMILVMIVFAMLFGSWIMPYMTGTQVKFYEYTMSRRPDLFKPDSASSTGVSDDFGTPQYPSLD